MSDGRWPMCRGGKIPIRSLKVLTYLRSSDSTEISEAASSQQSSGALGGTDRWDGRLLEVFQISGHDKICPPCQSRRYLHGIF